MRYLLGGMLLLAAAGFVLPLLVNIPELLHVSPDTSANVLAVLVAVWGALYAAAAGVAIWDTVRLVRQRDLEVLRRAAIFSKLAGIPFFVMNFVVFGVLTHATLFLGVGFIIGPVAMVFTYLVMLPTSAYGIGCLVALKRVPAVSPTYLGGHVVLHLMFVVDIISTLVVAGRARRVLRYGPPPPAFLG